MKNSLRALSASLALAASPAFALPPDTVHDVEVFIGGATAHSRLLPNMLTTRWCDISVASPLDIYHDDRTAFGGTADGRNYQAYSCKLKAAAPIPASLQGKTMLLHYRLLTGSFLGVNPLARATAVDRMAINATSCPGARSATTPNYKCKNPVSAVLDMGMSDQEPQLFIGRNLPAGETALTAKELGNITIVPTIAIMFGATVSDALYQALQTAQGKVVGDFTDDQRPNLTTQQLTSLFTANGGPYNTDWTALGIANNGPIKICKRINGVGQQISNNLFFGGYPCSPSALLPAMKATDEIPGQYELSEGVLIPDMTACLTAANNAGQYAIGGLWLDQTPNGWHFTKIDGVGPILANAVNGSYPFWMQNTAQYRNKTVNSVPAPSGLKKTFIESLMLPEFERPGNLTTNGIMALPENGFTPGVDGANVLKSSRQGSNCRQPVLFF
ncbi:MAG: hypothetical protein JNL33_10065 [Betaproteobacteria bacterium]|nr:hypothetical protein [Betaproteobacteria bacterium]